QTPPLSEECTRFIKRIESGVFSVSTSAAVVAEAIHKVMLAEAIQQHKLDHQGLAHRLQRQRELIVGLSEQRKVLRLRKAVTQHAAVRALAGDSRSEAPAVQLPGPSTRPATPHYKAAPVQR